MGRWTLVGSFLLALATVTWQFFSASASDVRRITPQQTISALETQVATLEANESESRNAAIRPTPTVATRSTNSNRYPEAVQEVVNQDSATECDEVGWAPTDPDVEPEVPRNYVCLGGAVYLAACVDVTDVASNSFWEPSPGHVWVACFLQVGNLGSSEFYVTSFDFTLVTASNSRVSQSIEPAVAFPDAEIFYGGDVPPDQNISGTIWFDLTRSQGTSTPYRIEIDPPSFGLNGDDGGVIIIEELIEPQDF